MSQSKIRKKLIRKQLKKGDILFFDTHHKNHVNQSGIYLGKEKFISRAKEKWIAYKNADARNIPVLKRLMNKPSFEEIGQIVESVIGKENGFFMKFCLYTSHQMVGLPLKEIGAYYDMRGSAVSQSNRRLKQRISKDKKLRQMEKEIKNRINSVEC